MKKIILFILTVLFIGHFGYAEDTKEDKLLSGWKVYRNQKYGYEIKFPEYPVDFSLEKDGARASMPMELFLTGPKDKRDGSSGRIAFQHFSAPGLTLDFYIYPYSSLSQIIGKWPSFVEAIKAGREEIIPDDEISRKYYVIRISEAVIGQHIVKKVEQRFRENNELISVRYIMDNVVFICEIGPSGRYTDFVNLSEKIISTFRFYRK